MSCVPRRPTSSRHYAGRIRGRHAHRRQPSHGGRARHASGIDVVQAELRPKEKVGDRATSCADTATSPWSATGQRRTRRSPRRTWGSRWAPWAPTSPSRPPTSPLMGERPLAPAESRPRATSGQDHAQNVGPVPALIIGPHPPRAVRRPRSRRRRASRTSSPRSSSSQTASAPAVVGRKRRYLPRTPRDVPRRPTLARLREGSRRGLMVHFVRPE